MLAPGARRPRARSTSTSRPESPAAEARTQVIRALGPKSGLAVQTSGERESSGRASARQGLARLTQIATLVLVAAILAMAGVMASMIWQRRDRIAYIKRQGFTRGLMWRALFFESAVLLLAGCSIGAVFGLYGQLLLSHALDHGYGLSPGGGRRPSHRTHECRDRQRRGARHRGRARISRCAGPCDDGQARLVTRPHRRRLRPGAQRACSCGRPADLVWGLSGVSREIESWRALAATIPDTALRYDALEALGSKRLNIDGAALFWTIPRTRSRELLRLLVAFEVLADYLDCASERGAHAGVENGLQLHRALVEALDPQLAISDHYRFHPWQDDGGYIHALVDACRDACTRLPSYEAIRPYAVRAARLTAQVLALNHEPDPSRRDAALGAWADAHVRRGELVWFERTAGASAWLTVLALLAVAADPCRQAREAQAVYAAYMPWVSLVGTMLDSYGDLEADAHNAAHSYIAHYPSIETATKRLTEITRRSLREAASLPDGARHVVIANAMIARYLSKGSVRTPQTRPLTASLTRAGGRLTRLLMPVLRAWRVIQRRRATRWKLSEQ